MKKKFVGIIMTIICLLFIGIVNVYAVTGTEIVNDLKNNYVGKYPYVLNTHGPNSFDCSGLVYYVYKQHGITLPMSTKSDWSSYGTVITDRSQLKDGDILFFGSSSSNITHEGVYDSNGGYIIQALNPKRGIIREPTLSTWINTPAWNSYGSNQFQFARRIISDTNPTPPSNARLSISSNNIPRGGSITFNCSANNATGYTIGIDRNGSRILTKDIGTSYTTTFSSEGTYTAYVTAWNSVGLVDSAKVSFTVYGKPTNPKLSINKTLISTGENITFTCSANNATGYTIGINRNGSRIETKDIGTSYTTSFTQPGTYTAYVTAWNSIDLADSSQVTFTVYNTAPTNLKFSANKKTVTLGENITFNCNANNATGYTIGINRNGNRILTKDIGTSYTTSFTEPGTYTAYITAWNSIDLADSSQITFTVKDDNINPALSSDFTVQKYTGYANITNNTSEYQEPSVIFAKYNNGVLLDTKVYDAHIPAKETLKINTTFGSDYKVFVWDSLSGMKPLCESK